MSLPYEDIKAKSFNAYLREISRLPLLTREEELALAQRTQKGDEKALRQLVEGNLRFVVKIANKYRGCGLSLLDLINEGNIGMIVAAKRFDPTRGVKFISYAIWWIRQAILQALADQCGSVRLPLKQAGILHKIRRKYETLSKKLGKEPTPLDLANELNIPLKEVEEILRVSRDALSLEQPLDENSSTHFIDLLKSNQQLSPYINLIKSSLEGEIEELLHKLTSKEEQVIKLRFGIKGEVPLTLEQVGTKMGLSRERIRQIEKRAKFRLYQKAKSRKLEDYLN